MFEEFAVLVSTIDSSDAEVPGDFREWLHQAVYYGREIAQVISDLDLQAAQEKMRTAETWAEERAFKKEAARFALRGAIFSSVYFYVKNVRNLPREHYQQITEWSTQGQRLLSQALLTLPLKGRQVLAKLKPREASGKWQERLRGAMSVARVVYAFRERCYGYVFFPEDEIDYRYKIDVLVYDRVCQCWLGVQVKSNFDGVSQGFIINRWVASRARNNGDPRSRVFDTTRTGVGEFSYRFKINIWPVYFEVQTGYQPTTLEHKGMLATVDDLLAYIR